MGVEFTALFHIGRPLPQMQDLPSLFRDLGPGTRALAELQRDSWTAQEWSVATSTHGEGSEVTGPGGIFVHVGKHTATLWHGSRWGRFLANDEHRRMLRECCFEVARMLASSEAIYMPDLTPDGSEEGKTFEEAKELLRSQFGPPAPNIPAIITLGVEAGADYWHKGCYYIDNFHDLTVAKCP